MEGGELSFTICVNSNDEVISHGLGLTELVGVAVMHHVIAGEEDKKKTKECLKIYKEYICKVNAGERNRVVIAHLFISPRTVLSDGAPETK